MKKVRFNDNISIKEIPNRIQEPRGIVRYLTSGIFVLQDNACLKIMNTLNKILPHKILYIYPNHIPFKVLNPKIEWYNDNSSIVLANVLEKNVAILKIFINEYHKIITNHIPLKKSASIEYNSCINNFKIIIDGVCRNV